MNRLFALRFLWLLLMVLTLCASQATARQFPYTAYVTGEQSFVRSGPGQRYYPTGKVQPGYAVEVYRHDDDGWCAIRPPAGSFSWVPSHQVRPSGPGVVEVIGERVVTRVGSTLSPNRSAVQVLLPQGERLELVAAAENDDPDWVRVAAPAGEFRWIAASGLSLNPPLEATPLSQATTSDSGWSRQSEQGRSAPAEEPSGFDHLELQSSGSQAGLHFGAPNFATAPNRPLATQTDPNAIDVVAGSPAELQLAQFESQLPNTLPTATLAGEPTVSNPTAPRIRFDGLTAALPISVGSVEELELRISQTVVQPPEHWQLAPLDAAASALMASTKTPAVRAQLREVQERIARFQQVQQRYNHPPPTIVADRTPRPPTTTPTVGGEAPSFTGQTADVRKRIKQDLETTSDPFETSGDSTTDGPLFAATGRLKPVISKREQAPQYALVDERGKVVSFVTPTPDLNLKPYLGRRIGVHGTRGYMPEYRRAHVTAGRVTPIEGTIRR